MKQLLNSFLFFSLSAAYGMEECPIGRAKGCADNVILDKLVADADLFCDVRASLNEIVWTGPAESEKIIVSKIKGMILLGHIDDLRPKGWEKTAGLRAYGLNIPGGVAALQQTLEPLFVGQPLTDGLLVELKRQIYGHFKKMGYPLISVEMPEQNVRDGVLQFVVSEPPFGKIICRGNEHFHGSTLRNYIHQKKDAPIQVDDLLRSVAFMNRSPYRTTNILFSPGKAGSKEGSTTDIVLQTKDRFPFRIYTGGDNTGTHFTGSARWFGGLSWGNVFNLDQTFTYQYTRSSEIHKFQSHTFYYLAPMPWRHNGIFYGGFASIHPSSPSTKHGKGFSSQVSGRYEIPLGRTWDHSLHQLVFGFDYKHTNNTLDIVETESSFNLFNKVNLTQLMAGYTYVYASSSNQLQAEVNFFGSPCPIMGGSSNHDFSQARSGAKNQYFYARAYISDLLLLPGGWELYSVLRAQGASNVLFPSEEFGLGGYNTVRGYSERTFNADNMTLATLQVHSPKFSLLKLCGGSKQKDHLYFLTFFDGAGAWNFASSSDVKKTEWLMSVGLGLRYQIGRHLQVRADYGFKLHRDSFIGRHIGKAHVGATASY